MSGRLSQATGSIDGNNVKFFTLSAYIPGTLVVFLNGQQLKRELDNGWIETDPSTGEFEMKIAPVGPQGHVDDPGDILFAYWHTDNVSIGGADGGVPIITSSTHLKPNIGSGIELNPSILLSSDQTIEAGNPINSATEIKPENQEAFDLKPSIADAKEV